MRFEEAYRGIRKLHAAQLFKVLFAVLAVALLIITLLVGQERDTDTSRTRKR